MTDLDIMKHAKGYIDKMANGINPLTDNPIDENDFINNVRISRCLFYVSGVLDKVIENGGQVVKQKAVKKSDFKLTKEQLSKYEFPPFPVSLSEIASRYNALCDDPSMKKFAYRDLSQILIDDGVLEEYTAPSGRKTKRQTEKGLSLGIYNEDRVNPSGATYTATLYGMEAQTYIFNLLSGLWAE